MKCPKCSNEQYWHWTPAGNEEGWECGECQSKPGEPEGYCPELDRDHLYDKVYALLLFLCGEMGGYKFLSISNGAEGEYLTQDIVGKCRELGMYDQTTICRLAFEADQSHAEYWKEISDGILSGNDPRDRCHCGKLANSVTWQRGEQVSRCSEHSSWLENLRSDP
jgi:hypothetical protein